MSDFQTVDLDAVLDQFESEFDKEEREKTLKGCDNEADADENVLSVNRLTLKDGVAVNNVSIFSQSFSDDLSDVKVNQAVDEPNTTEIGFIPVVSENKETSANDTLSHSHTECEVKSDWIQSKDLIYEEESLNATEISTSNDLTLNHDLYLDVIKYEENKIEDEPNLLSHFIAEVADESAEIKNDSSEGYLFSKSTEVSTTAELQVEAKIDLQTDYLPPTSISSNHSSQEHESIYDKYCSRLEESTEPIDGFTISEKGISFETPEISDEKLEEFFTELENKEAEIASQREMGARPKELRCDSKNDTDSGKKPVEVVTASSESPPPYSEIDPVHSSLNVSSSNRPTTLDIGVQEKRDDRLDQTASPNAGGDENDEPPKVANIGPPGSTPANPSGPGNTQIQELIQGLSEDQLILGKVIPFWVPDSEAPVCMICDQKFTLVKRRHHCRACGKVLCSLCGSEKAPLPYLEEKEARVCKPCKGILERLQMVIHLQGGIGGQHLGDRVPNPANPMEYCSTIPPHLQASNTSMPVPSVVVPISVLKRFDATPSSDQKQVMFSDGIRPGGALTELDEEGSSSSRRSHHHSRSSGRRRGHRVPAGGSEITKSMIPPNQLPYVSGRGPVDEQELRSAFSEQEDQIVPFIVNRNLRVYVSLVMYLPINKKVWNFKTLGMTAVGQDEILLLLVQMSGESLPPREIFEHFQSIYELAGSGTQIGDMGHSVILSGKPFLDSTQYGGFLFFRPTFQSVDNLDLPARPFLCAVLLTKWEMPWARVFPLRLLLRLGAEARYYPCPLWSTRQRQTVFKEIGNTIMKLLSDFRNFSYSLPIIRAMVIHMEDKLTTIIIPKNSYSQIQRALQNSNDPVLALGANFSSQADSHLVAVQRDENEPPRNPMNNSDYETQAINILNKPRKVTGASFLVLNGALKSASGLTAKSSIVEDGIMVQVSQERMLQIRKSLNQMEDCQIDCGPIGAEKPDETVYLKWVENDLSVNAGIKSVIDGSPMDGITSVKVRGAISRDVVIGEYLIRWTELFLLPSTAKNSHAEYTDPPDPARVASQVADAVCFALGSHLKELKSSDLTPLAVRVHLDPENAGYEAGSKSSPLPGELMNHLDNFLVPVVHGQVGSRASFELVFHVLDI